MPSARVLILGCGFTGTRVARKLLAAGHRVVATSRRPESIQAPGATLVELDLGVPGTLPHLVPFVWPDTLVLYSIPESTPALMDAISSAGRVVYLSTTGVYGCHRIVDHTTPCDPSTPRARARLVAEQAVLKTASPLILRPAAIYGPHRGIHTALRDGYFRLAGDGRNFVSRIHVDDLAAHSIAGLFSDITGAWPVADEEPCPSIEIAAFCARLLGVPLPPAAAPEELSETRRSDRRVDGSAIRRALGVQLRYPTYREGIPACIAEETATPGTPGSRDNIARAR